MSKSECLKMSLDHVYRGTLIYNVLLINPLQDLSPSSSPSRTGLDAWESQSLCTHTFLCLECSSESWFLLTFFKFNFNNPDEVQSLWGSYSVILHLNVPFFFPSKINMLFITLFFFFLLFSLLDYEFNLGKTYNYLIPCWFPSQYLTSCLEH